MISVPRLLARQSAASHRREQSHRTRGLVFAGLLGLELCLMAASQTSPPAQNLIRQGQAALDASQFSQAVTDFQQALKLAPDNLDANRGLLLSYLHAGQLADAVALGQETTNRWPQDAELWHWLGLAYFKSGRNADALEALQRSETLGRKGFGIHFDVALVLLEQNQDAAAADELEAALKIDASDGDGHHVRSGDNHALFH